MISLAAIMTCDSMPLNGKSDAATAEVTQLLMHSTSGGNISDASSSSICGNRGDESSSSASDWTNHQRLDVTRAASECSITDDDLDDDDDDDGISRILHDFDTKSSLCAEDSKLEMDVLEADYNLLGVQKGAALQTPNKGCTDRCYVAHQTQAICTSSVHSIPPEGEKESDDCSAFDKTQLNKTAPNLFEDMGDLLYTKSRFAQEALGHLRDISNKNECRMPQEDPTFALQDRLQKLLLAAVLEHECPMYSGSQLGHNDAWHTSDRSETAMVEKDSIWNDLPKDKRSHIDPAAHRDELEFISSKLASQKGENWPCFRRQSQQTLAEEMYCKETIRQIVQQVQAEIEQWSQMQDILHNLQQELDGLSELQKAWEDRALQAEAQLKCLQEEVYEWRCRSRSTEEELVMLRCEKQILKNKIDMMEDTQLNPSGTVREAQEKPRSASVGTQHEDFALCESFVHSRNESGRSSVDLGTSTQRSFRKSIKKSFDFVSSKNGSNPSKFLFGNLGLSKGEPAGLEFSSKKVDVVNSKGKPKGSKTSGHFLKLNTAKLDSSESTHGHDHKERKKARLFASKENRASGASVLFLDCSISKNMQDGSLGHADNAGQGYTGHCFSTKPKSSWPSAPASTPSRIPFGEIVNLK